MSRARVGALAGAVGLAGVACQALVGVADEEGTPRPNPIAAPSATPTSCERRVPPAPPEVADAPDGPPVHFAVTALDASPKLEARPVGFDLDGICTGLPVGVVDGGAPCARAVVDDPGGIDNAGLRLFPALEARGSKLFRSFARAVREGEGTVIISLSKYSGRRDDPVVEVRVVPSGRHEGGCDAGAADGGPGGDGCDVWALPGGSTAGRALDGYVANGELVVGARGSATIQLAAGPFHLALDHSILVATIGDRVGRAGPYRVLEGTLAGRATSAAVFTALSHEAELCAAGLADLRGIVCDHRDIPSSPADDRTPAKACGSISVGVRIQGVQARPGSDTPGAVQPPCTAVIPSCD